jgi:hypothetical protein
MDKISRGGESHETCAKDSVYTHSVNFVDWDGVVVASTGLPSDLEAGGLEV